MTKNIKKGSDEGIRLIYIELPHNHTNHKLDEVMIAKSTLICNQFIVH